MELERERTMLKKDLQLWQQKANEALQRLEGIEQKQARDIYELRLQLEDKARKQMVVKINSRSLTPGSFRSHMPTQIRTIRSSV